MTENYKIIGSFIKDMSSETPDSRTYIFVRDKISKYKLNIDINSKAVKKRNYWSQHNHKIFGPTWNFKKSTFWNNLHIYS